MKKYFKLLAELASLIAISSLLTVLFTYPAILHLNDKYIGDGWDNYEYASYQQLAAKRIAQGQEPFGFTNYWRFPVGFDFARGFDSYLTVTTGALLNLFVQPPLSYNLTIFFLFILNGCLSYAFFRYISASRLLGALGAVVYGFSFYTIAKASSHPNLMLSSVFCLFSLSALRLFKKEELNGLDYSLFFGSVILTLLASLQYFLILSVFLVLYSLLGIAYYQKEIVSLIKKIGRTKHQLIISFLWALVIIFLLYSPHIKAALDHSMVITQRVQQLFIATPSLFDYVMPNPYLKLFLGQIFHNTSSASIEKTVFLGWIEIGILAAMLFYMLLNKIRVERKKAIFVSLMFTIPLVLSFGYGKENNFALLPYHFLAGFYPFKLIPETGRYFVIYSLISTTLTVLFLKKIKAEKLFLFCLILLLLAERTPYNFYLTQSFRGENYTEVVKKEKSTAVLDIPVNTYYSPYNILSFEYSKPIVNGYFHWSADGEKERAFIANGNLLGRFGCLKDQEMQYDMSIQNYLNRQTVSVLKDNGIKTIVVHKDDKFFFPDCKNVRTELEMLFPHVNELKTTSDEKQIVDKFLEGKISFSFFLPYDGKVYLDGVYFSADKALLAFPPDKPNSIIINVNGNPLSESYSWETTNGYHSMQMKPKFSISQDVVRGSYLTFASTTDNSNVSFSLWYRYEKANEQKANFQTYFKKIFEDDKAIVYRIQ